MVKNENERKEYLRGNTIEGFPNFVGPTSNLKLEMLIMQKQKFLPENKIKIKKLKTQVTSFLLDSKIRSNFDR